MCAAAQHRVLVKMEHRCSGAGGGEQDGDNVHAHAAVDAAAAAIDQNCSEQGE